MQQVRQTLKAWWVRYDRAINLISLAGGFAFDLMLAKRPDSVADNLLLLAYLAIAAIIIVSLALRTSRRGIEQEAPSQSFVLIFILQFCFGGLASNLLILYGKSGTFGVSLLFVGLLAAFALSNEFLKSRYDQLRLNTAVYYFLLLTYCIIAVPTFVLHRIGTSAFLISGATSLGAMFIFLAVLGVGVFRVRERRRMREVAGLVLAMFLIFNGLYFLNIVPPVPLSLKSVGVYHTLTPYGRSDAEGDLYSASYEVPAWWVFWRDTAATYSLGGQSAGAYCFGAVFAPGDLGTSIVHRWEKYDDKTRTWEEQSSIAFPILGGREGGYRGWSYEAGITPGEWRCDIETGRGQLIGRMSFTAVSGTPALSTTEL